MKLERRSILFFILVGIIFNLYGQNQDIKFDRYSTKEGLSQSSVVTIYQDDEGFMWFGTYGGLNRFDGYNFKVFQFNQENPYSISDNHVRSIAQDSSGVFWIGTTNGLNRFYPNTQEFVRFLHDPGDTNSISHNTIYKVLHDNDGDIWIGTWGGGLDKIQSIPSNNKYVKETKYQFTHYSLQQTDFKPEDLYISDMIQGSDNSIWIATRILYRLNKITGEIKAYAHDPGNQHSISSNNISALCEDKSGYIWVGTWEGGLNKLDPESGSIIRFYHNAKDDFSLSHNIIMSLYCDHAGNIWVGTWGGGLNRIEFQDDINRIRFNRYVHDENDLSSISGNSIYSIYQDRTASLWAGTDWSGINKFKVENNKFRHIYSKKGTSGGLVNNIVHTLLIDRNNQLWIGTQDGLNIYNPVSNSYRLFTYDPGNPVSLSFNHIRSVVEDKQGNIWVGTLKGLNLYNSQKKSFIRYFLDRRDPGGTNNLALCAASDGIIWIGNYSGGLFRFDPDTEEFKVFDHEPGNPQSISDNQIWTIAEDADKMFWVGTGKGGLCRFDPVTETFTCYRNNSNDTSSIGSNTVWALYFDHESTLWVGTSLGLDKVSYNASGRLEFMHMFKNTDLENQGANGITSDLHNNLWVTISKGLVHFDPVKNLFTTYNIDDGLQDNEFSNNSIIRNEKTGEIYAGGINGFNIFDPGRIKGNPVPPEVKIVDLKLFNKSVAIGEKVHDKIILEKTISSTDKLKLSHKEYVVTFEYAALHYDSPEGNQYAFMLENFENDWNYVGNKRSATYTNLKPGNYTFRVKACNNDNIWNETGTALEIYIKPPFWKTVWFVLIMVIVFLSLLYLIYYIRITQIKKRNIVLEQTVKERTREIKSKNELLLKKTEELNETNTQLQERQKLINEQSEELMATNNQLSESNSKLTELNTMKNKFFSIIAHDLKNPINVVLGFADLLQKRVNKISDDIRDEYIDNILKSANRTYSLLENLLEWARSQSGRLDCKPALVNIEQLMIHNISLLKEQAKKKAIQVRIESKPENTFIYCDEKMIDTVIRNLLSNAIKYTHPGGRVEVIMNELEKVNYLVTHISDSGVGIKEDQIDKLFLLDKAVTTSGTSGEEGTGLGLILCKEFIEKNRGEIWVMSRENEGSTFSFSLPVNKLD